MAHLRSDYPEKWNKYIKNNKEWKKLELEIEKVSNKSVPDFFQNNSQKKYPPSSKKLKLTDKLKLTSKETKTIDGLIYAQVKVGTYVGLVNLNRIRKPTGNRANVMAAEEAAIRDLNKIFKALVKKQGPINIKVKGSKRIFNNCVGVRNVSEQVHIPGIGKREAKSDFNIIDADGNDVIFISHKKTGGAKAFQQYGGTTPAAGSTKMKEETNGPSEWAGNVIEQHKEVQSFLGQVARRYDNAGGTLPNPMYKIIKDKHLIMMSVFGPEYKANGPQNFSIDNVNVIGQGKPVLSPTNTSDWSSPIGNLYILTFTDHMVISGDSRNQFMSGDYAAVLGVRKENKKGFNYGKGEKRKRYANARTGIFPKVYFENRTGVEKLK
jgi:hypothetical protein